MSQYILLALFISHPGTTKLSVQPPLSKIETAISRGRDVRAERVKLEFGRKFYFLDTPSTIFRNYPRGIRSAVTREFHRAQRGRPNTILQSYGAGGFYGFARIIFFQPRTHADWRRRFVVCCELGVVNWVDWVHWVYWLICYSTIQLIQINSDYNKPFPFETFSFISTSRRPANTRLIPGKKIRVFTECPSQMRTVA